MVNITGISNNPHNKHVTQDLCGKQDTANYGLGDWLFSQE